MSEYVKISEGLCKFLFGKLLILLVNLLVVNKFGGNFVKCVYCKEYYYFVFCERVKDLNKCKEILVKEC